MLFLSNAVNEIVGFLKRTPFKPPNQNTANLFKNTRLAIFIIVKELVLRITVMNAPALSHTLRYATSRTDKRRKAV